MLDTLQNLVIDQIQKCTDPDLLDLIMKLLVSECSN